MTVDESTAADPVSNAPHLTVVTPPPVEAGGTIDLRTSTDAPTSLADLQNELSNLRARVKALETEPNLDVVAASPAVDEDADTDRAAPGAPTATSLLRPATKAPAAAAPPWQSKTSRVSGWQPTRR